nr:hypothetical protein [Tanacetum cinerariifolium]
MPLRKRLCTAHTGTYELGESFTVAAARLREPGDEEEDESFDDEEDDDIYINWDEYLAPADSIVVTLPAVDHAPSAEETESFETDESAATPPPHPAYRITARMSIRPQTPIS